jgi:hypothetical protein
VQPKMSVLMNRMPIVSLAILAVADE